MNRRELQQANNETDATTPPGVKLKVENKRYST